MMKVLRKSSESEYYALAQNGAVTVFNLGRYRMIDGFQDETRTHFILDLAPVEIKYIIVDLETAYEVATRYHCGGDKLSLIDDLDKLMKS